MSKKQFNVINEIQGGDAKRPSETTDINTDKGNVNSNVVPITPTTMKVHFPENLYNRRTFDFAPYYGQGFDAITTVCQATIEKLIQQSIDTQQAALAISTIAGYCHSG